MKNKLLQFLVTTLAAAPVLAAASQAPSPQGTQGTQAPAGQRPATGESGRPVVKPTDKPADKPADRPADRPAPVPAPGKESPPAALHDLAKARGLFNAADANHDGKVEPREASQAGVDERNFKLFDDDHDGAVTLDEFVFGYRGLLREANQTPADDLENEVRRIAEMRKAKQAKEERRENGAGEQGERRQGDPESRGGVERPGGRPTGQGGGQGEGADRPAPKPKPEPKPAPRPPAKPKPKPNPPHG